MRRISLCVLTVVVGLFAGATAAGNYQAPKDAPRFSVRTLGGRVVRTEDLIDSIVVLDFWATWCEPCIAEIPVFNELQKKYAGHGVKVIGVAVQSGWPRDIRRFAKRHKMEYPIVAGNDDVVSDFDVISFPTTYLIAQGWKVYRKYPGTYPEKRNELERGIDQLLAAR